MNAADTLEHALDMSPPREERRVNVERLSFPLPIVLAMLAAIALTAFGVGGLQYALTSSDRQVQAQIQSDLRNISTTIAKDAEITSAYAKLQEERSETMRLSMDEMRKRIDLLQLQYSQLRETMLTQGKR